MKYGTKDNEPESEFIHEVKTILLYCGFIFAIIISILVCLMMFLCANLESSRGDVDLFSSNNVRNRNIVNTMRKFPFGSIAFREATECSICLENFENQDASGQDVEVVQLKCSKYHIFHDQCLKEFMNHAGNSHNKKCPLCRKPIEI